MYYLLTIIFTSLFFQLYYSKVVKYQLDITETVTELNDLNTAAYVGYSLILNNEMFPDQEPKKEQITRYTLRFNNSYPGPLIEAYEGDEIEITYCNQLRETNTLLHFHGISQINTPYNDGAPMVTNCPLPKGQCLTVNFTAEPAGTHMYHSHYYEQALLGLVGPLIIKEKEKINNPKIPAYDDEIILSLTDVYADAFQLHTNFFTPVSYVAINGIYGNGSDDYPYYQVEIEQGKCYRIRYIAAMFELCGIQVEIKNHTQTVIAIDGSYIDPINNIDAIAMVPGQRIDAILCANQDIDNYWITIKSPPHYSFPALNYSFQTMGETYYGILHYKDANNHDVNTNNYTDDNINVFDITWQSEQIKNINSDINLAEATIYKELDIGSLARSSLNVNNDDTTVVDYDFYFWFNSNLSDIIPPYQDASTPLLHTKGQCCLKDNTNFITIEEEGQVLDLVINNRNNMVHSIHLHGKHFYLLGTGYSHNRSDDYPQNGENNDYAPCQDTIRFSDPNDQKTDRWGCPYNQEKDEWSLNKKNPAMMDTIGVPPYSWAYIRYIADVPGIWTIHCHSYDHTLRGMKTAINVMPSKQPNIPETHPKCGPCDQLNQQQQQQKEQCQVTTNKFQCIDLCKDHQLQDIKLCDHDFLLCKSLCSSEYDETCLLQCAQHYAICSSNASNRKKYAQILVLNYFNIFMAVGL